MQAAASLEIDAKNMMESERGMREFRRALLVISRAGSVWSVAFTGLMEENQILHAALDDTRLDLLEHGFNLDATSVPSNQKDPVDEHRQLQQALDRRISELHGQNHIWAKDSLRRIRRGLADAALIQNTLLETADQRRGNLHSARLA